MHTAQYQLRNDVEAMTVRACGSRLLHETGPVLACVWPDLASWLDDLVPQPAGENRELPSPAYRLTEQQRRRLLSPEFDTVYRISDAVLLSRLILAALRHSELSVVFAPANVSQGKLASLLRLAASVHWWSPQCWVVNQSFPRRRESSERAIRPWSLDPRLRGDDGRTAFHPVDSAATLRADWLLDVGSYEGDDKVVRIFADKADRLAQLTELLAPLSLERTAPSEGHTS